ncbi:hypothetical protein E8E15_000773 [Penicillium rubens]|nr:hypothetical protein E8E15_000773 [Penicillium rubens]KAJ5035228.1 hypothetical protein NUH16_005058 [Penicillium rubens]
MPNEQPTRTVQEFPVLIPPISPLLVIKQDPPLKMGMSQTPNTFDPRSQGILEPIAPNVDDQESEAELSIPVDHSTAAHKLLTWPSIKRLLHPTVYDEDYVMRLEEEHGLISIYGQGETSYTADGTLISTDGDSKCARPDRNSAGLDTNVDIDEFGNLNLDATVAKRYYGSYIKHMFKLHPFLVESELNAKFDSFIQCYCRLDTSQSSTTNHTQLVSDSQPPAKARRSNETLGGRHNFMETISNPLRRQVGKNIDNALVMLCLALGAICESHGPLPGPIMNKKFNYLNQPIPIPLPQFKHPPAVTRTHGMRNAAQAPDEQGNTKNYQVIPGLTLYGYATAILGHLQGGNELEHVQCGLLAGLYAGQLAHPFQSHSWISHASRACQMLIRTKRYERLEEGPRWDLYNFVYWTCLQLESDLLAELDLPASGISRYEDQITIPKGKWTIVLPNDPNAHNTMIMLFYSAQIHLRKILNRVHTCLYKVNKHSQGQWSPTVQKALSDNLDSWRKSLPENMQWDESDPPANEINAARLRAKYYGAQYIVHRPLLCHALHYWHSDAHVGSVSQPLVDSRNSHQLSLSILHGDSRVRNIACTSNDVGSMPATGIADWQPPKFHLHELPKELRLACSICIKSAIKSTEAFDGVRGNRLVVTNIFGTAHAQFGNMLVLSATYMSNLKELVDKDELDGLLIRTIGFLIQSENISPTLRADARILAEIYRRIYGREFDLPTKTTNASSP